MVIIGELKNKMIVIKRLVYLYILLNILCSTNIAAQLLKETSFLPLPTGKFTVGTTDFFISDTLQKNRFSRHEDYKKLHIKIWYPSDSVVNPNLRNNYLHGYCVDDIYDLFKKKGIVKEDIQKMASLKTYSTRGLPISELNEKYPLILFTPGYYFGLSDIYSSFVENLASNGYIVCSIIHVHEQICIKDEWSDSNTDLKTAKASIPFLQWFIADLTNFKDVNKKKNQEAMTRYYLRRLSQFDKTINRWEKSTLFVIDYLKNQTNSNYKVFSKIDFNNIGTFGQSLGGALATHICVNNDIIKAGVNMDCIQFGDVIDSKSTKPLLLIESDHQKRWKIGNEYIYRDIHHLEYLRIKGALHFLFCDLPYYDTSLDDSVVEGFIGDIDGKRAVSIINDTVLDFFNNHLGDKKTSLAKQTIDNEIYLYQITNKCIYLR